MANINIQIKQRNGEIWDDLYPKTMAENVEESVSKRFVSDTKISQWNDKQDSLGFTPENVAKKGVASGYAELDPSGKVPTNQLPSYVDDVLEYTKQSIFPDTGETGKIYVALDSNRIYRWSGTTYVEISSTIALGETSATAYRGDRGLVAYNHSQAPHAPTNAQKNSDITKAEIEAKLMGDISSHSHANVIPKAHALTHVTGSDTIPVAAKSTPGLMSGDDKTKLDGISTKANLYTHPTSGGNKHIPTGGTTNQMLVYGGSSGTAKWASQGGRVTVGAKAPASPAVGDFWYEII